MIATSTFSIILLLFIITKVSCTDLTVTAKVKPLAPDENQNAVPVSQKYSEFFR